jgi:hypothetical protein
MGGPCAPTTENQATKPVRRVSRQLVIPDNGRNALQQELPLSGFDGVERVPKAEQSWYPCSSGNTGE